MEKPFLKNFFEERLAPELKEKRGYKNIHQIPRVSKVVINSGINSSKDKNWIEEVRKDISSLAGQKAVVTRARKSISNFKLREGMPNGVKVTLRGARMYDFMYRLIAVSLPNIRDFRGVGRKMDGAGNYTLGISDHTIFPEIPSDSTGKESIGMDITFVTTAETDAEAFDLLKGLGLPFKKTKQEEDAEAAAKKNQAA